jgi:hypothetical protein
MSSTLEVRPNRNHKKWREKQIVSAATSNTYRMWGNKTLKVLDASMFLPTLEMSSPLLQLRVMVPELVHFVQECIQTKWRVPSRRDGASSQQGTGFFFWWRGYATNDRHLGDPIGKMVLHVNINTNFTYLQGQRSARGQG